MLVSKSLQRMLYLPKLVNGKRSKKRSWKVANSYLVEVMSVEKYVTVVDIGKLGKPAILVHGGAGGWQAERVGEALQALRRAVDIGLKQKTALDMVVEAIAVLEDSGVLNAGIGSVLTFDGRVQMDAGLMYRGWAAGVGAVSYPRNPIRLAKEIYNRTRHVLLVGADADTLAAKLGLPKHPGPITSNFEKWVKAKKNAKKREWVAPLLKLYGDTVGAVALDQEGHMAAGASTGGISLKHPGRVGDSPIPGAGYYAEDGLGACSATGIGETILLGMVCRKAVELLSKKNPVEALKQVLYEHTSRFGENTLGVILLSANGEAVAGINTKAMPIGYGGTRSGVMLLERNDKVLKV
ncbi:MAG TPA: asparaginase [Pyrodictium sp.]|nr:asparaginase [Pyrodictium sp.]